MRRFLHYYASVKKPTVNGTRRSLRNPVSQSRVADLEVTSSCKRRTWILLTIKIDFFLLAMSTGLACTIYYPEFYVIVKLQQLSASSTISWWSQEYISSGFNIVTISSVHTRLSDLSVAHAWPMCWSFRCPACFRQPYKGSRKKVSSIELFLTHKCQSSVFTTDWKWLCWCQIDSYRLSSLLCLPPCYLAETSGQEY